MEDVKLTMSGLLQNTDTMADVLGFLTRREIALQLASVNVAFSALCHCWCQPMEEVEAASVGQRVKQRKRKFNQGLKCKKLTVIFLCNYY